MKNMKQDKYYTSLQRLVKKKKTFDNNFRNVVILKYVASYSLKLYSSTKIKGNQIYFLDQQDTNGRQSIKKNNDKTPLFYGVAISRSEVKRR